MTLTNSHWHDHDTDTVTFLSNSSKNFEIKNEATEDELNSNVVQIQLQILYTLTT